MSDLLLFREVIVVYTFLVSNFHSHEW